MHLKLMLTSTKSPHVNVFRRLVVIRNLKRKNGVTSLILQIFYKTVVTVVFFFFFP